MIKLNMSLPEKRARETTKAKPKLASVAAMVKISIIVWLEFIDIGREVTIM